MNILKFHFVCKCKLPRSYDWADKVLKHLAGASKTHNGDSLKVTHLGWQLKNQQRLGLQPSELGLCAFGTWRCCFCAFAFRIWRCLKKIVEHLKKIQFKDVKKSPDSFDAFLCLASLRHSNNPFGSDHMSFLQKNIQSVSCLQRHEDEHMKIYEQCGFLFLKHLFTLKSKAKYDLPLRVSGTFHPRRWRVLSPLPSIHRCDWSGHLLQNCLLPTQCQ